MWFLKFDTNIMISPCSCLEGKLGDTVIKILPEHLGSSMGGLIIVHAVLKSDKGTIQGAILHAPAITIHPDTRPSSLVEHASKLMLRFIPKIPLVKANKGKNSSPEVSQRNESEKDADPLFYSGRLRIGTGLAILGALEEIENEMHRFDTPYLLQHGTADRVCHLDGSKRFHEKATAQDKTFITYQTAQHDLMHEPDHIVQKLMQDLTNWLNDRCSN